MSNIFSWDNYEDNPNKMIGVDTIATQKKATWSDGVEGHFNGDAALSFFTNTDEYAYPQLSKVKGVRPMVLTYGKGYEFPSAVIPSNYDVPTSIEDIPTEGNVAINSNDVANAMTSGNTYDNIILTDVTVGTDIKLNATDDITVNNLVVSGTQGTSNGKICFSAKNVEINNMSVSEDASVYNVFEGSQTDSLESLNFNYASINGPDLTHNLVNVYKPADNAIINIKNSDFDLNVSNSNVVRLSNVGNASNVVVNFENVNWTYENASAPDGDWEYAGLVLYQAFGADHAAEGVYDELSTWTFNFKNCKYNGEKVTENNFGTHKQAIYLYGLNHENVVKDYTEVEGLTVNFS